ncbi:GT-D fold domain-containing glycosyltransferase [Turicibacter sanguinis]|uniref:GT-D fold domain-containing glycosyltransferase n=1 Tax=Turicibacter sanguinis TaxID=154288 RepID=UPI0018AA2ED0|nr:GT-D fold domain-containing glycosyltransferase [Turicibacter sanguinis]MDB8551636.1 GT-D fold domain-containing glycosyltransferase [Turicibacter sanguinis]
MISKLIRKIKNIINKISLILIGKRQLIKYSKQYPKVKTTTETLDLVINENYSIVRYGDGEFKLAYSTKEDLYFQKNSSLLSKRLKDILNNPTNKFENKIMVCIPPFNPKYNNTKNVCGSFSFWEKYWFINFKKIKKYLNENEYGNSFISRLDVFYENDINYIKKIWNNKDIVFVASDNGRFEINHQIFNNCNSKELISIPAINAFEDYENIFNKCLKIEKNKLILIAAGPTATVLAFDLAKEGYQAIDIGHLSNSYDQFLGIIDKPENVPFIKNNI